ncbi:estradiol 17-beta-dehydrogenase 2 isoform X2 [Suricata suricatta]|uniref:estradiol 17-beta-dehydrogenase 2 isoform X2 n=1 Tax=Suricata suricatta TaxID=37032 RepID=UPI001155320B|nr:estradiol 17-beta-dehydrogenase 2 isoform X2 [Suricata suricatta]
MLLLEGAVNTSRWNQGRGIGWQACRHQRVDESRFSPETGLFSGAAVDWLRRRTGQGLGEGESPPPRLVNRPFVPTIPWGQANSGGDSGFGHALSKYLDQLGFTVFVGVLHEKGPGAEELRRTCSERLSVLQMDITDSQQIKDAHSKVVEKLQNRGLWALVNNAGIIGLPADGELVPMTNYKQCMAVNFFGAVEVTKTFLPLLRKSKGRLVNISSMAGGVPFEKMAAYSSSKAALTMFSAILRQELSQWEVKVSVIQPGGFRTNISGTPETWSKLERDILDNLTPEVLEDYGQDYILGQLDFLKIISRSGSPDVSPVLRDIRHAVSAKRPCALYSPGPMAFPMLCFVSFSPTGIFDYFNKKMCHFTGGVPKALTKQA